MATTDRRQMQHQVQEQESQPRTWSRGTFLRMGLAVTAPLLVAACGGRAAAKALPAPPSQSGNVTDQPLSLTPAGEDAGDAGGLTPAQTEGPYFKPNSPERASLFDPGMRGTRLVISGRVLAPSGEPIARALLDFWQADAGGTYDNRGYTLRGHQYTDDAGQYRVETIEPGLYPGRTRHIHVKVQAPNGPILTTQLYFPGEARNATDSIYDARLVLPIQDTITGDGKVAAFDFVVNVS